MSSWTLKAQMMTRFWKSLWWRVTYSCSIQLVVPRKSTIIDENLNVGSFDHSPLIECWGTTGVQMFLPLRLATHYTPDHFQILPQMYSVWPDHVTAHLPSVDNPTFDKQHFWFCSFSLAIYWYSTGRCRELMNFLRPVKSSTTHLNEKYLFVTRSGSDHSPQRCWWGEKNQAYGCLMCVRGQNRHKTQDTRLSHSRYSKSQYSDVMSCDI